MLGLIVGSFLATVAMRWPAGRSVSRGRSACDSCGRRLRAAELVPVLSYALQRGRCRTCGAAIDHRHPAIEIAAAVIGATALAVTPAPVGLIGAAFGWSLLLLAVLDVEHHWLPDRLTLPLAAAGLLASLTSMPPDLLDRLIGLLAGYASLWIIATGYRLLRGRVGMGGGDSKLMAALGAWLGWALLPVVLLLGSLMGLAAVAAARARGRPMTRSTRLPLGALLAVAAYPAFLVMVGTAR
nr:A24 family peptidase [Sphingomonas jejuensis]